MPPTPSASRSCATAASSTSPSPADSSHASPKSAAGRSQAPFLRSVLHRSFRRPATVTAAASPTDAHASDPPDLAPPVASPEGASERSPTPSNASPRAGRSSVSRIGRSFEAVLASDDTYVLQGTPASVPAVELAEPSPAPDPRDHDHPYHASQSHASDADADLAHRPPAHLVALDSIHGSMLAAPLGTHEAPLQPKSPSRPLKPLDRLASPHSIHAEMSAPASDAIRGKASASLNPSHGAATRSASSERTSSRRNASASTTSAASLAEGAASTSSASTYKGAKSMPSPRMRTQTLVGAGEPGRIKGSPLGTTAALLATSPSKAALQLTHSLADEVSIRSPPPPSAEPVTSSGGGTFKERMKKTSGFLRKLRSDGGGSSGSQSQERRDRSRSSKSAGRGAPNASSGSSSKTGTRNLQCLSRNESQTSFASEGASSLTHSNYSVSSVPTLRSNSQFGHADEIPVPLIPSKYTNSTSDLHHPSSQSDAPYGKTLTPSPRARGSSKLAASSMELPVQDSNGLDWVLPQRSSSQTLVRMSRLSNASSGDVRLAVRDWAHAMDDALKDAACDLARKTEFTPKASWGPSPTLPALDLSRNRERSGSFMDDSDAEERTRKGKGAARAEGFSTSLPSTPKIQSASLHPTLGIGSPTSAGAAQRAATYGYTGDGSSRFGPRKVASDKAQAAQSVGLGIPQRQHAKSRQPASLDKYACERRSSGNGSPLMTSADRWSYEHSPPLQGRGFESPGESVATPRSSTRNSIDSARPTRSIRSSHARAANSGASLASARSFETAAESAVTSTDPAKSISIDNQLDHATIGSTSFDSDPHVQRRRRSSLEDRFEEAVEPEQSIRLITSIEDNPGLRRHNSDEAATPVDANVICIPADPVEQSGRLTPSSANCTGRSGLETISEGLHPRGRSSTAQLSNTLSIRERRPSRASSPGIPYTSREYASPSPSYTHTLRSLPAGAMSSEALSLNEDEASSSVGDIRTNLAERGAELAAKCWNEDVTFLKKEKIAEWLGGIGLVNNAARHAYFNHFDFHGLRIDIAFRRLCDKLFLRAETQQIDRILRAFSERYFNCNKNTVFSSADEVHSVVFSLLLLNTDLHVAEIQDRMTRSQFVRNTMSAIAESRQMEYGASSLPGGGNDSRSSLGHSVVERGAHSYDHPPVAGTSSPSFNSLPSRARMTRSASTRSRVSNNIRQHEFSSTASEGPSSPRMSMATLPPGIVVSGVPSKGVDGDLEALLKDIYAAVKSERILLPENAELGTSASQHSTMRRRGTGERVNALKRGSIRGIQGLLGAPNSMGGENPLSTSPTSIASRSTLDPLGILPTSTTSAAGQASGSNPTTIGFASTLTQTIIRESQDEDTQSINSVVDEPDDDELALMGPPWAKEGSLSRKYYWEAPGKRAKDKNWTDVFVVVQKGVLSMFRFGDTSSRSKQSQAQASKGAGGAIGGGNWLSNAIPLGEVNLAHTLANVLPPPGYNRDRPHVFALTLPGGAVYFFQAGHEELVAEWVQTCNYWAARQSKEPLPGGVSNMEYGWNKILPSEDFEELDGADDDSGSLAPSTSAATSYSTGPDISIYNNSSTGLNKAADSRSVRSARSSRSSRARAGAAFYQNLRDAANLVSPNGSSIGSFSSPAPSLLGTTSESMHKNERIHINEWKAPAMPMVASTLKEDDQLDHCLRHLSILENELTLHNELRQPMLQLYSPRGPNYTKALSNWERKSNHLLQELVKYQCYADSLKHSVKLRADRRGMKEVEGMMRRADEEMSKVRESEEDGSLPIYAFPD
ncbi:hypothetical protein ACQY0O_005959 [Thecaphora frezii]